MAPWTVAWEFSKQEYWNGLPFPTLGDLPDPGIELASPVAPALQADSLPLEPPGKPYILYVLPPNFALIIIDFYHILINIMVCDISANQKKLCLSILTI